LSDFTGAPLAAAAELDRSTTGRWVVKTGGPKQLATLWDRSAQTLVSHQFQQLAQGFDRRPLIQCANSLGGPSMRLLHWMKLKELRRLPRSDEGESVDAIDGIDRFGARVVEMFMVSHRWLRPSLNRRLSHPDGPNNEKALALDEFSLWRRQWVLNRHGFLPELYYWIDYSCIDQEHPQEAFPLLPLWTSCCERFLRIETADYDDRMWCRLEPLLACVFSFADHHIAIGSGFRCQWPYTGTESSRTILDPRAGQLTDPRDAEKVVPLVGLAMRLSPASQSGSLVEPGKTQVKCFSL
jgi:hypothetical protein